jgi:hypothetical protein
MCNGERLIILAFFLGALRPVVHRLPRPVVVAAHEAADRTLLCQAAKQLPYRFMACEVKEVFWGKDFTLPLPYIRASIRAATS